MSLGCHDNEALGLIVIVGGSLEGSESLGVGETDPAKLGGAATEHQIMRAVRILVGPGRWALCLFSAIGGCSSPEWPDRVRIATWNLHNLSSAAASGSGADASQSDYAQRVAAIARVLDELDADIIVVQEVAGAAVLDDLARATETPGYGAGFVVGNDGRGMNLGLLSRIGIENLVSHRNDEFDRSGAAAETSEVSLYRYARDCLEIHASLGARSLVVLGVHFKSQSEDDPDKRLAEARHTRLIADGLIEHNPSSRIAIVGDMNDIPGSAAYLALVARPGDRATYVDAATALPGAWTYRYDDHYELLDHLFANPELAIDLDPASVTIDHGRDAVRASDHAPLVATYRLK